MNIFTIGLVCEQLKDLDFALDLKQQHRIFEGIVLGLNDSDPNIRQTAFGALREAIPSILELLKGK